MLLRSRLYRTFSAPWRDALGVPATHIGAEVGMGLAHERPRATPLAWSHTLLAGGIVAMPVEFAAWRSLPFKQSVATRTGDGHGLFLHTTFRHDVMALVVRVVPIQ
jgi:hypothetical protein